MNYSNDKVIQIGDFVQLWSERCGYVVCLIGDHIYTDDFPESDWRYLKEGILIKMENNELIHYPVIDEDLKLLKRTR